MRHWGYAHIWTAFKIESSGYMACSQGHVLVRGFEMPIGKQATAGSAALRKGKKALLRKMPKRHGRAVAKGANSGKKGGWDGRIRTYDLRYQKALPYH